MVHTAVDITWFYMVFRPIKYQHIYEADANNIVILNGRQ